MITTMKHFPCLLILIAVLALSACTTVPVSPERKGIDLQAQTETLQRAKSLFLVMQYAEAAGLLLPLAQQGHAEAQYAVGYMYHYGYGLPRNEREATRWITTAAALGYPKAQEAMRRIEAAHPAQPAELTPPQTIPADR
jgi:TPR repeat protein